jgi:hypothetical protein
MWPNTGASLSGKNKSGYCCLHDFGLSGAADVLAQCRGIGTDSSAARRLIYPRDVLAATIKVPPITLPRPTLVEGIPNV